jgi:hypothetical protein
MHNQKQYVIEKIIARSDWGNKRENVVKLLNELQNIDLTPITKATYEESTIGWITAGKMVEELIKNNQDLTVDNFKNSWKPKSTPPPIARGADVIDDSILNKKYDLEFLLSIAPEDDLEVELSILSEQGLRASGFIGKNETSLDAVEIEPAFDEILSVEYQDGKIVSPYTGSENIYQINSFTYMDLENNKIFRLKN